MKLSIIIISYNEVHYLGQAISSIVNLQNVDDYEIVIVDDGSNDGSIGVIKEWQGRYPSLIKLHIMDRTIDEAMLIASIRVSNAIKKALSLISGKYVTLMAGDDFYLTPELFARQIEMLESEQYSECVGCATYYQKYWDNGKSEDSKFFHDKQMKINSTFLWGSHMYIHVSAFVFRNVFTREETRHLGSFIDDIGFVYHMSRHGDFCCLPEFGFAYRQRPDSIMKRIDQNERRLCELLLFQDIMKHGAKKKSAAYSKIVGVVRSLFSQRSLLSDPKYDKYFLAAENNGSKWFIEYVCTGKSSLIKKISVIWRVCYLYLCYLQYRIPLKMLRCCYGSKADI